VTLVRIKCVQCARTSTPQLEALLLDVAGGDMDENAGAVVNWICGGCSALVSCPVSWRDLRTLVSAGAFLLEE
jgi:hypothetical protein